MFALGLLIAGLTLWLGLYLLQREAGEMKAPWVGALLVAYATVTAGFATVGSPWTWWLAGVGVFLWALDLGLARRGVIAVGEAFWPDAFRSLTASALTALVFGLPVVITLWGTPGATPAMRALLSVTVGRGVGSRVFPEPLQRLPARLVFPPRPSLQQARAELRSTAETLPKADDQIDLMRLNETDFARLTRRALSCYGDLPRLTASPLLRLPVIDRRLAARGGADNTLARAAELKQLLYEAILHLKPANELGFSASDAWRHYNALYYPYVIGLKPYSRHNEAYDLDAAGHDALEWLRTHVPERTLHNWQNAAARLVAHYLREAT